MPLISINQPASGLDIFTRFNGELTDPIGITYEIFAASGTSSFLQVGDGSGFRRSLGHYDARNSVIPSGYNTTRSWYITWAITSPAGVTTNATEEFNVAASIDSAFTNLDDLIDIIKVDMGLSTQFTQEQLELFISKALRRLNRRLRLVGSVALQIDPVTGAITPSPSDTIFDLIILQTECLIAKNRRASAVSKGIRVKDGDSEIDTVSGFGGHAAVVDDFCQELEDAIKDFLVNGVPGGRVLGELITYDNSRICEDQSHDGQSDNVRDYQSPFDGNNCFE